MIYIAILIVVIAASYFIFRKKKPVIQYKPIQLKQLLSIHIEFYNRLSPAKQDLFEQKIEQFLSYVSLEGVGFEVNDTDRIMVAASAVIPIFGFEGWTYRNITNVLLYPDTFDHEFQFEGEGRNIEGMVGSGYMNGQMILSRSALQKGFSKNAGKENTAIHEFVHLVDGADGATDGIPEGFLKHKYTAPWVKMMHQEINRIEKGHSDINPYAITNQAEFFAVTSEYFFEKPEQFQNSHPELYTMLSRAFAQDTAKEV
ncbi:Mlc titration factor MtfA (ptsG expression regulator) [Pedobacter sp. UYP24]